MTTRAKGGFRLEDCADDVAAVAERFGIERLIAVGYSMGGAIAQLLWMRHRRSVDGLVLCSTSAAFRSTARLRMLFGAAAGVSVVRAGSAVNTVSGSPLAVLTKWNDRRGDISWGAEQMALHDWRTVVEAGHQIGRYDARDWVSSITVPTSVIATLDDDIVPTRHQIWLALTIPDATLRRVPGGHHRCVTHPERFESVLMQACREIAARSSVLRCFDTTAA